MAIRAIEMVEKPSDKSNTKKKLLEVNRYLNGYYSSTAVGATKLRNID
jgi:hypothetical protein